MAIRATAILSLLSVVLGGCGGARPPDADPLASIADEVSENERLPPPLSVVWGRYPATDNPLTLRPTVGTRYVYLALGDRLEAWAVEDGHFAWGSSFDSELAASPVLAGGEVIVATGGDDDSAPTIWWLAAEDGALTARQAIQAPASELAALQGTVVYADASGVARLGGSEQWRVDLEGVSTITASEEHGLVFVTTADGELRALGARDGSLLWLHELDAGETLSRPVVGNDLVYVGGTDARIVALRMSNGQTAWKRLVGVDIVGAPAVAGELVWVAGLDATLRGLKASNGTLLYELTANMSRNYLDMTSYGLWAIVGPRYGPWIAVRGPTREEPQRPTQVRAPNSPVFLEVPPASGPAGVAVVNGDGLVMFMRPVRPRRPSP